AFARSRNMVPRLKPNKPEPPTRSMSRRLIPSSRSHRSFPGRPGTMIMEVSVGFESQILDYLKSQISNLRFQISDFKFQISNFRFQISDFKFQISNFRFQISDFKFQISNPRSQRLVIKQKR